MHPSFRGPNASPTGRWVQLTLLPRGQVKRRQGQHEDEHWPHHAQEMADDAQLAFRTTKQTNKQKTPSA